MGEMVQTSTEYCKKCVHSWRHTDGSVKVYCHYLVDTGLRRNCPIGMCDKFEKRHRGQKITWGINGTNSYK